MLPGKVKGIGGAMDLVANPSKTKVVVTMEHVDKKGNPKILPGEFTHCKTYELSSNFFPACTFPLTGPLCVWKIITDLAVFNVHPTEGLTLVEVAEGVTVDEVTSKTAAPFQVADDLKTF